MARGRVYARGVEIDYGSIKQKGGTKTLESSEGKISVIEPKEFYYLSPAQMEQIEQKFMEFANNRFRILTGV